MSDKTALEQMTENETELAKQRVEERFVKPNESQIGMPFGKKVARSRMVRPGYSLRQAKEYLGRADKLMKEPKRGYHYGWCDKEDPMAQSKINMGLYRKVKKDELQEHHGAPITTHEGTDDGVYHYRLMLIEISPQAWLELYEDPVSQAADRLTMAEEQYTEDIEKASRNARGETLATGFVHTKKVGRGDSPE
jgi:hypothetical protein